MSIQKILPVQNPILRQKARPVTSFDRRIQRLVADLTETLLVQKNPLGVGLAASQIGKNIRVFVVKLDKNVIPFINPEIVWKSKETNDPHSSLRSSGQAKRGKKSSNEQFTLSESEREYIMEGCLSLPHYYGPVKRASKIKVRYSTLKMSPRAGSRFAGEITTRSFRGLSAQIIQHEIDHLHGLLFVDRLLEQKRKLYRWTGKEWEEVELP